MKKIVTLAEQAYLIHTTALERHSCRPSPSDILTVYADPNQVPKNQEGNSP